MHKSSLLEIIRTFTPKELLKFEDFVNSPYHNKNKNLISLFLEIKKYAPEFIDEGLEKENIWKKLFPGKEYNYGIMKNIIHDLNKLCESFLAQEFYNTDELRRSIDFLESIFDRDLKRYFENKFQIVKKSFTKNYEKKNITYTGEYFYHQKKLNDLYESFLHDNSTQTKNKIDIKPATEFLIYSFLIECFKLFHKVIGHDLQYNNPMKENILYIFLKDLDEGLIVQRLLKYFENKPGKDHLILKCYYSMYRALTSNEDPGNFFEFKKNISDIAGLIPKSELRDLYFNCLTCLTNLKVTLINFKNEYFAILQLLYKSKLYLNKDGSISPHLFFSTIGMACSVNELYFAENFIKEYSPKIPPEFREAQYNFAMSALNFSRKNFKEALEYLSRIQNESKDLKYHLKNLQITIYYELNDRESFEYAFDSLKHFIRKNKLTNESRILTLINYCEYIRGLFKLTENFDSFKFDSLKKQIEQNKVANKLWLLRKLDELDPAMSKVKG